MDSKYDKYRSHQYAVAETPAAGTRVGLVHAVMPLANTKIMHQGKPSSRPDAIIRTSNYFRRLIVHLPVTPQRGLQLALTSCHTAQ